MPKDLIPLDHITPSSNAKMGSYISNLLHLRSASRAEDSTSGVVPCDLSLVLLHVEVELLRRRKLLAAPGAEQPVSVLKIVISKINPAFSSAKV